MPLNTLGLPDDERSVALACVLEVLRRDPALRRLGVRWKAWAGDPDDAAGPSPAQCPMVRLTPRAGAARWDSTTRRLHSPIEVAVETWVSGYAAADSFALWRAIERALFPAAEAAASAVGGYLAGGGVFQVDVDRPAAGEADPIPTAELTAAVGHLTLHLYVDL